MQFYSAQGPRGSFFFSVASENKYVPHGETMALKKSLIEEKGRFLCMYRGRRTNLIIKANTGLCCHME